MPKIKRCKYCGAKNVEISHFARKHRDALARARKRKSGGRRPKGRVSSRGATRISGPPSGYAVSRFLIVLRRK